MTRLEHDTNDRTNTDEVVDHVFYKASDYAGISRRFIALVVDLAGLVGIWVLYDLTLDLVGVSSFEEDGVAEWYLPTILIIEYLYLTLLKRSRVRTPGYWVTGLRIVNLKGRPPSMFLMSMRLFWWVLGPINPLIDFIFIANDDNRQTLRDKLMGTYVVKRNAEPAGGGPKFMGRLSFMGLMLMYPTVRRVASVESDADA